MASTFISYRRGDDVWAGLIELTLSQKFDVFIDKSSIKLGAEWPLALQRELEECEVMLVVVGKEWASDASLARLSQPEDWVRKELMAAFRRGKAVQIVPVLVDTGWPDADQLPADLRWLLQREGQVIRGAEQRSGLAELVKKLEGCLSRRGPGRDSAEPFPWVLPYLCNRIEQEEDLEALIKAQGKGVFACVLHGQVEEVHQGFIDRLTYMRTFDRFFGSPAGVDVRPLTWNRAAAQHKKFDALLRSAVGRCVPASNPPTGTELEAFLADAGRPQVLVLQVTWDDYKACGSSLLPSLVGSWLGLFRSQGTAKPITPSQPMVLWINLAYSTPDANVDLTALEGVLPALPSVQSADIEEWMALREVKTFVARKRGKLLALTEDQRWSPKNGKVHMVKFAEAVEEILNAS